MTHDTSELIEEISVGAFATILIIGGIIIGLYGNALHKAILFLLGFLAGAFLVYFILHNVGIDTESEFLHYSLIIACVVGVFTGCLALSVYNTAIFIIGSICGMIIAQLLWHLIMDWFPDIQYPEIYNIIIVILFAIIFGIITVKFIGVIVKPLTAFIGSYLITSGSAYFVQKYILKTDGNNVIDIAQFFEAGNECDTGCWIFLGVWILLFIICLLYQYEVCSKGGVVKFSNVGDEEGVSDAPHDEAEDNLLVDV